MTDTHDAVHHPKHYTSHASGIEVIKITQNYGFNLGNAFKYLARLGMKDARAQELGKAKWYVDNEIEFLHFLYPDSVYRVSHVENKGMTLNLVRTYLSFEEPGLLTDVKTLVAMAPFYTTSVDALMEASGILQTLIDNAKEGTAAA